MLVECPAEDAGDRRTLTTLSNAAAIRYHLAIHDRDRALAHPLGAGDAHEN